MMVKFLKHIGLTFVYCWAFFCLLPTFGQRTYVNISSEDGSVFKANLNGIGSDSLSSNHFWHITEDEVLKFEGYFPSTQKKIEELLFINLGKSYEYKLSTLGNITLVSPIEKGKEQQFDFDAPLFTFGEEQTKVYDEAEIKLPRLSNPVPLLPISNKIDLGNCQLLTDENFVEAKEFITNSPHADSRLSIAKQIAQSNCLTSDQVIELVELFKHENSRLEFLMFCYDYTIDSNNYGMAINSLRYEFTRNKFVTFLKSIANEK